MIRAPEAYQISYEAFKLSHMGQIWAKIEDQINHACKQGKFEATVSVPEDCYRDVMKELNDFGYQCTYGRGHIEMAHRTMSICIHWKHHQ